MPNLVANFNIEIPGQCLITWPEGEPPPSFRFSIGEFEIALRLIIDNISWGVKKKGGAYFTRVIEAAEVGVLRQEDTFPPEVVRNERGQMDYRIQADYFRNRSPAFEEAAHEAVNRVIRFFRYKLNTPLLYEIPVWHQSLCNPKWKDETGKIVGKGPITIRGGKVHGSYGELGVLEFTPDMAESFSDYLSEPSAPSLTEEILTDAQSAWFDGNLRRSVLELAIACEIIVKRRFFSGDSPAGAAFDYLEDRAKVSVRVPELLDRVCLEAFARSFRVEHSTAYLDVDHLFRCRNKIAHRGDLSYRDDGGHMITVDASTVQRWWNSVATMRSWLDKQPTG